MIWIAFSGIISFSVNGTANYINTPENSRQSVCGILITKLKYLNCKLCIYICTREDKQFNFYCTHICMFSLCDSERNFEIILSQNEDIVYDNFIYITFSTNKLMVSVLVPNVYKKNVRYFTTGYNGKLRML